MLARHPLRGCAGALGLLALGAALLTSGLGCRARPQASAPKIAAVDGGGADAATAAAAAAAAATEPGRSCGSDVEPPGPKVRCQLSLTGPPRDAQTLLGLLLQRADERNRAGLALHKDAAPHGKPPGSGPAHAPDGKADGKPDAKSATTSSAESEASCRPGPDPDDPALPLFREALACTTLAMRFPSPSVAMLRQRGIAQRELGAVEDARDTFSRALATAPDDPALLADAADLYISHLSATREHSEIGLLYAERGQKQLQPNPSADAGRGGRSATRRLRDRARGLSDGTRELLAQLHLLTGQALLDLGRASQALPALDAALRLRESPEARYERAVALFELCRFPEAQVAFEQLLAGNPSARKAAWSHYHLGLILEQLGQGAAAERELALAQKLMPDHFPAPLPIDAAEFARLVKQESDSLPKDSAADLKLVRLELADIPDPRDLTLESPPLSPTILGLYRGLPLGDEPSEPRSIVLYRKNLLRAVRSQKELVQEIEKTLLHELGHLHGADEDDLREEGLE